MRASRTALTVAFVLLTTACAEEPPAPREMAAPLGVEVLGEVPHDPTAFTQGLELVDGTLYEGTGLRGRSELRVVDPATGRVRERAALPEQYFGEGITVVGDRIWQLTWEAGVAIERDRGSLAELRRVGYEGEGWGLCFDETADRLVMSDGTDRLTFRDPDSFTATGSVGVVADTGPVTRLNELECVDGVVYANVWKTDRIVRIDPGTGDVTGVADLSGLLQPEERSDADVLNGIAHVPGTDEFLVTGKLWPTMFRVRLTAEAD